jgi:hypothetical protein
VVEVTEERSTHPEEPGKKPRPWRPTYRQVFWAIGMVVTLMTITLLVAGLYPDIWQALSRERVMLIGIGVALVVVIVLLAMGGAALGWTGFRGKTLWDLLQLLVVPLVLVGIGFLFEMQQAERQGGMEERQQALEDQRAKAERKLAEQRAQDEALQAYLDQMSTLLLEEKDLRNDRVRTLMRARTLTVLGRLDPSRKTAVTQFLVEAELVQRVDGRDLIIYLLGADLSDANLSDANLSRADLSNAVLDNANLGGAEGITNKELEQQAASLEGATMPNGQKYEDWLKSRGKDRENSGS